MSFGGKLKKYRKMAGITQEELGAALGIGKSTVSEWEKDKRTPDIDRLGAIAAAIRVLPAMLLDDEEALSAEWGSPILSAYSAAPRPKQEAVCTVLDIDYIEPGIQKSAIPFRLSEQSAAAGDGIYLGPESFYEIYVNVNKLPQNAAFGIPVRGDSMEPVYHDGDILIVSTEEPRIGEVGVFTLGGAGYVKKRGACELISLNEKYKPIPMDETIRCNGKVVGILDKNAISK